jgi:hypothetical protein
MVRVITLVKVGVRDLSNEMKVQNTCYQTPLVEWNPLI